MIGFLKVKRCAFFNQEFSWGIYKVHLDYKRLRLVNNCAVNFITHLHRDPSDCWQAGRQWSTFNLINFGRWQNWVACTSLLGDLTWIQLNVLQDYQCFWDPDRRANQSLASWSIAINNICQWHCPQSKSRKRKNNMNTYEHRFSN